MMRLFKTFFLILILTANAWAKVHVFPDDKRAPYVNFIQDAKHSLDLMIYVIDDPEITKALLKAHGRGVKIRLLAEGKKYAHAETQSSSDKTLAELKKSGIEIKTTPAHVAQMHAKLMIQDGKTALISTGNMDQESFDGIPEKTPPARDFAVDVDNAALVGGLQGVFEKDWKSLKGGYLLKFLLIAPMNYRDSVIQHIGRAEKTIDIYQQDFTDPQIQGALVKAIKRGVFVRLIMMPYPFSKKWDKNIPFQEKLRDLGATVTLKDDLYIHAKLLLIDRGTPEARAVFGSSNFYAPSLDKNREIGLIVTDPADLQTLSEIFNKDV